MILVYEFDIIELMAKKIPVPEGHAWCGKCRKIKPRSKFAKNSNRRNGLQARCNKCRREYNSSVEAVRLARDRSLRKKFGISLKQYEVMTEAQSGCCAICGKPEKALSNGSGRVKGLALDHCHKTGRKRKLLCQQCNTGLGCFDTVELLRAATEYLNETAVAVA